MGNLDFLLSTLTECLVVEDELVKVVRTQSPPDLAVGGDCEFKHQVLSGVRFSPLISNPRLKTVIPARLWTPSLHKFYPDSFQQSSKALFLCSRANYNQHIEPPPRKKVNAASLLPRALWMEILSYTHRDCKLFVASGAFKLFLSYFHGFFY